MTENQLHYEVYMKDNPKHAEYQKAYRLANKDKQRGYALKYAEKNRDKLREYQRQYRLDNPTSKPI